MNRKFKGRQPTKSTRDKLERALCTLADHEGAIKDACGQLGISDRVVGEVCRALRLIVDGEA